MCVFFKKSGFHIFRCVLLLLLLIVCISLYFCPTHTHLMSYSHQVSDHEVVSRKDDEYQFMAYLKRFRKSYEGNEYYQRFQNFKNSVLEILRLSVAHQSYKQYGFTKFSDMTKEEFEKLLKMDQWWFNYDRADYNFSCGGKKESWELRKRFISSNMSEHWETKGLPPKVDWRVKRAVGPVLDQGFCLSCWAHSVVGVMESMLVVSKLTSQYSQYSVQELVDCSNYTSKCAGGSAKKALDFLCYYNLPIVPEKYYSLTNKNGSCKLKGMPGLGVRLSKAMVRFDVPAMKIAYIIAKHGPVIAIVNALSWQNYLGGVIQYHCSDNLDYARHVVQIVGYDMSAIEPYFIIRNSWGTDWGDDGYVYTSMTKGFICGIGREIWFLDVDLV